MTTQKTLRAQKRLARKNLSASQKAEKSQSISERLIATKAYQNAQHIAAYLCLPEEVDVSHLIKTAWADGKQVYLPVVLTWGKPLQFAPYQPHSTLIKDTLDIPIPNVNKSHYIDAKHLDLVITPLVAFDQNRNRIGMGGGFYDRTFAFKAQNNYPTPTLIAAAFAIQKTNCPIPSNDWDIRPDKIITENQMIRRL